MVFDLFKRADQSPSASVSNGNVNGRNQRGGRGGIHHPSLPNGRSNGNNRSETHRQGSSSSSPTSPRVRFPDDVDHSDDADRNDPLEFLVDLLFGTAAFVCSLGLITILVILYLIVRPFSIGLSRRLSNQLGAAAFLDAIALMLPNTQIYLTGDSDVPSPVGTSILVSNHLMDGDWWTILMLGRCVGIRGSVKVFLRNEILHITQNSNSERSPRGSFSSAMLTSSSSGASPKTLTTAAPRNGNSSPTTSSSNINERHPASPDLTILGRLLHSLLEFPLMNGEDYISDRQKMFMLLRSFSERSGSAAPAHLLLFPESWCLHNGEDRKSVLAKSNEFARREGRPQLKHLLLPRTTGFNASLESLRESSPVVYDVTMAYRGYDGSLPPRMDLSLLTLWNLLRRKYPAEIYIRVKRYSIEEVLHDASWLDKKWAEKDRLLDHFSRYQQFPPDGRGFCRHRVFETRSHSLETSIISLVRMLIVPCAVPVLLLLSIPIFWTVLWAWVIYTAFKTLISDARETPGAGTPGTSDPATTPGTVSATGTPFFPATPFASPSITNWRDMLLNNHNDT